jgi:hypothetical protein
MAYFCFLKKKPSQPKDGLPRARKEQKHSNPFKDSNSEQIKSFSSLIRDKVVLFSD